MKYLKLFESYSTDIHSHLKGRGVDPDQNRVIIDDQTQDVYFFLYNLSGQMVGYQKYNPNYPKTGQSNLNDPSITKYFNLIGDEGYGKKIAVWGLESVNFQDDFIFITEGIFDIARVHEAGYPGIAVLCNDPSDSLKTWLKTLPQKKIVIYDNDIPGKKLIKLGDYAYTVRSGKDLNDLTKSEAKEFLDNIVDSLFRKKVNESSEYYKKIDPVNIETTYFDKNLSIRLQNLLFDITNDFFCDQYEVAFNTDRLGVDIYQCEDEWFVVTIIYFSNHFCEADSEFRGQQHYYMCDQYEGLLEFLNDKVINIKDRINESLFLAEKGLKKIFVDKDELLDTSDLLIKLNKSGFDLGSGHEEIELNKISDDEYRLDLVPYYGHPGQSVLFHKIS